MMTGNAAVYRGGSIAATGTLLPLGVPALSTPKRIR